MATTEADAQAAANPPALGGVVPYLTVGGAVKAAEFYARAFGATEVARHPPDEQGRTMHVHLHVNGGSLMLSDPFPEYGHPLTAPQAFSLMLPVEDIEAWWKRAVEAGAEVAMPLAEMFWGDRYGQLRDPFGVIWAMNAPIRN
jgi:PhnB protein